MPITRSSAKKKSLAHSLETSTTIDETPNPPSRVESNVYSRCDLEAVSSPFKLPFFDENEATSSRNYDIFLSPSNPNPVTQLMISSEWENELSPIARSRDSDASQESLRVPPLDYGVSTQEVPQQRPANTLSSLDIPDKYSENNSPSPISPDEEEEIRDLTSVQEQVGQSSHQFIERIRNAAHKRKVAMARSRDSLAAKEQQQLRSIAENKNRVDTNVSKNDSVEKSRKEQSIMVSQKKTFKALPLPPTTGSLGSGGLDGVPKIEKKPTTTPFSPLLGARRPQKVKIKALAKPKQHKQIKCQSKQEKGPYSRDFSQVTGSPKPNSNKGSAIARPFKARAVPLAVRAAENGGQYGIPKVEKRPLTVAMSPQLGPRRRSRSVDNKLESHQVNIMRNETMEKPSTHAGQRTLIRSLCRTSSTGAVRPMTAESPLLRGLKLLNTPGAEQEEIDENVTPTNAQFTPFEPHSTRRARERAEFDNKRKTLFEIRTEREMKEREKEIRCMQRDLNILRWEI